MADTRGERRAAERAARELIASKVTLIGDVAEAAAARTAAHVGVDAARQRARELVEQARREGDRLVVEARAQIGRADDSYASAFHRAVNTGWAAQLLIDLGYAAPTKPRRRRESTSAESAAGVGAADTASVVVPGAEVMDEAAA
ncbi:hypothetical protein [Salinispora arenicola]|uniref:hypothetical protein n=1 Tax=Salinispora arenicola TaxID=168697 RepID=UPI0012F8A05D|nr:hypothetical protein [Salinispora arenicola]